MYAERLEPRECCPLGQRTKRGDEEEVSSLHRSVSTCVERRVTACDGV